MTKIIYVVGKDDKQPTYGPVAALVNGGLWMLEKSIAWGIKRLLPLPGERSKKHEARKLYQARA